MHLLNCLPCTGLSASFSYSPMGTPHPYHLLWNAPFLNHNHIDHNLQASSITPTSPAFYLSPLGLSDHLFNCSLSDNPVPSMYLEIQPRIAQTPPCTELTICLYFLSLCQLPPTFFSLPSLHIALPSLDLAMTFVTRLLLIFPALCLSLLPGRNQPWATQLPAFSAPAHRLAGAARDLGPVAELEQHCNSQPQPVSFFPLGKSSCVALVISLPSHRR